MDEWIVISCHTNDDLYRQQANKLIASLKAWDIPYVIEEVKNTGSWAKNTHYKPTICLETLEDWDVPVLFLDADSEVIDYPFLIDTLTCDVAMYFLNEGKPATGTVFVNNTDGGKKFLRAWIDACKGGENVSDQKALKRIWPIEGVSVEELPASYCKIFDKMEGVEPVIRQNQASRLFNAGLDETDTKTR